jgi:EmrB/QacA subfamily drug resistance transporter
MPPRRIALIIAAASFIQMLDGAIIATSLPQMARDFGVEAVAMSLGVTAYLLASAIFMPLSAWLADRLGAVRVFLLAIALFTLASVACGLAQDLVQFVLARIVQGVGGAFMVPVGRLIVLRNAPKSEVINVLALITWPALIAPVIGPTLGGAITTYFSWRLNFLINVPLGAIGFLLALIFIRETGDRVARPLDWIGFLLCASSLALLLIGLESMIDAANAWVLALALIGAGIATGWLAIRHLQRAEQPLLDLSSFRHPSFALSNLFAGSYGRMAVNAMPFLLPLLFQIGLGLGPLEAGALMFAYFIGNLVMKSVTTPIIRRFGFRMVLVVNGLLCALSIAGCAAFVPGIPLPAVIAVLLVAGLTRSMQFTALSSLAFADVEPQDRSSASTLVSMLQQISMVFGVAAGSLALNLSLAVRGEETLALVDFQVAILAVSTLALLSTALLSRLAPDAGAEISGHRVRA